MPLELLHVYSLSLVMLYVSLTKFVFLGMHLRNGINDMIPLFLICNTTITSNVQMNPSLGLNSPMKILSPRSSN